MATKNVSAISAIAEEFADSWGKTDSMVCKESSEFAEIDEFAAFSAFYRLLATGDWKLETSSQWAKPIVPTLPNLPPFSPFPAFFVSLSL